MKFWKQLIRALCFVGIWLVLLCANTTEAWAYANSGLLTSTNLLVGEGNAEIESVTFSVSALPTGTGLQARFSRDGTRWFDASGTGVSWETLSAGGNVVDLSSLNWVGTSFYYQLKFTSDGAGTPVVDDVSLAFTAGADGIYDAYYTSGTLTSVNLLAAEPVVVSIDEFAYNASSIPGSTGLMAQFSQDNSTWYSSSGTEDGSDTLSSGSSTIDLSSLGWSGTNFYYRINYTSDSTATPVLDSVNLSFTADATAPSLSLTAVSPDPNSNETPTLFGIATEDEGTVASVEFQLDGTSGSWTACTADDGAFDEISEAFTCTVATALADGSHTMYVRATDSNGNVTASDSYASDTFTIDITAPLSFSLESPGNQSYTNNERPSFKWKATSDTTSSITKYKLTVDNGEKGDFTIDDIPVSRDSDYETSKYVIHYENFDDADATNNYISVYTKSSSDWGDDHNDGKLKEGKRTWQVTAYDTADNSRAESRTLFVDRTGSQITLTQVNAVSFSSDSFETTDATPTIFGKVTDDLSGDQIAHYVASGPKSIELRVEKQGLLGAYALETLTTINLTENYWTLDGSRIDNNTLQTSGKYSPFEFTPQTPLSRGQYRLTFTGKDAAGNNGAAVVMELAIGSFAQLAAAPTAQPTPAPKVTPAPSPVPGDELDEIVEQPEPTPSPVIEDQEITRPVEVAETAQSSSPSWLSGVWGGISTGVGNMTGSAVRFTGNLLAYFGQVGQQGWRALAATFDHPRQFASIFSEWLAYTTTSFGEIVLDDQPTQISDVKVAQVTPTAAVITWKTNHLATSKVNYGLTKDYGQDVQSDKKVHDHRVEITGLEPGVTYNYEVMSQNKNYVYDANHEFSTPELQD